MGTPARLKCNSSALIAVWPTHVRRTFLSVVRHSGPIHDQDQFIARNIYSVHGSALVLTHTNKSCIMSRDERSARFAAAPTLFRVDRQLLISSVPNRNRWLLNEIATHRSTERPSGRATTGRGTTRQQTPIPHGSWLSGRGSFPTTTYFSRSSANCRASIR